MSEWEKKVEISFPPNMFVYWCFVKVLLLDRIVYFGKWQIFIEMENKFNFYPHWRTLMTTVRFLEIELIFRFWTYSLLVKNSCLTTNPHHISYSRKFNLFYGCSHLEQWLQQWLVHTHSTTTKVQILFTLRSINCCIDGCGPSVYPG